MSINTAVQLNVVIYFVTCGGGYSCIAQTHLCY